MSGGSPSFLLPANLTPDDLRIRLGAMTRAGPSGRLDVRWLDSFDWRLDAHGLRLECSGGEARCHDLEDGRLIAGFSAPAAPLRPGDLPDFPGRARLAAALAPRALVEQARLRGRYHGFSRLDAEGKTVLRLQLDEGIAICPESGRRVKLPAILRLLPVRGYDDALRAMSAHLVEDLGLRPLGGDGLVHVLAAFDRRPGDYSSRLDLEFSPRMTLGAAARMIHLAQIDLMERNTQGIIDDIDSEYLHDFRVAVRRARSALHQLKGALAPALEHDMKGGLKRLGDRTSPLRDLDVLVLDMPQMRARLPADMVEALDPFAEHLAARRAGEHRRLVRHLATPGHRAMLARWRVALGRNDGPGRAGARLGPHADARIWKLYRRLRKQGRAIDDLSPPAALHELRKTGKMLRYLIEFFASLYDREEIATLVRDMKRLQDILGQFQDREVQATALRGFAREMSEAGPAPLDSCLALGIITGQLLGDRDRARAAFAKRFADFDSARVHHRFRALFHAGTGESA